MVFPLIVPVADFNGVLKLLRGAAIYASAGAFRPVWRFYRPCMDAGILSRRLFWGFAGSGVVFFAGHVLCPARLGGMGVFTPRQLQPVSAGPGENTVDTGDR